MQHPLRYKYETEKLLVSSFKQIPGFLQGQSLVFTTTTTFFVPVQSSGLKADGKTAGSCGSTIDTFLHSSNTLQSLKAKLADVGILLAPP